MEESPVRWTNASVKALAAGQDPIEVVTQRARTVVLDALEAGWTGPPFDPMALADHLGLAVLPRQQLRDARTVPAPNGHLRIEFNPNRPPGRVRYSIAHEIAHTLFPDCADDVRHRAVHDAFVSDAWQLEMLCNIAAAEFLMPTGSFVEELSKAQTSIDALVQLRHKYDVSLEAILIRVANLTDESIAAFVASRIETGSHAGRYRLDYAVPSLRASWPVMKGALLAENSVVTECRAIGFTAKGTEHIPGIPQALRVECVGLPPYPGSTYPRVAGVFAALPELIAEPGIVYLVGSALEPRGDEKKIIAHVVNDKTPNWGGHGFATKVGRRWPAAQADFRDWIKEDPAGLTLGSVRFFSVQPSLTIASMVAQHGYGPSASPRLRYSALEKCLRTVAAYSARTASSLHMPRIGTGYAGGSWFIIEDLLRLTMLKAGLSVTVYELPRPSNGPSSRPFTAKSGLVSA